MDPIETVILNRRSIRRYKPDMPPPTWIETMIACASMAPSPSNSQPVRFVRLRSPEVRSDLRRAMIQKRDELLCDLESKGGSKKTRNLINVYFRYSEFMFDAPVLLAVGTPASAASFSRKLEEAKILPAVTHSESDPDISVGLALMNLMLKCTSLGLGTCVLTAPLVFLGDVEKTIRLGDIRIKCFATVGFPDEIPSMPGRKSISEIYREI